MIKLYVWILACFHFYFSSCIWPRTSLNCHDITDYYYSWGDKEFNETSRLPHLCSNRPNECFSAWQITEVAIIRKSHLITAAELEQMKRALVTTNQSPLAQWQMAPKCYFSCWSPENDVWMNEWFQNYRQLGLLCRWVKIAVSYWDAAQLISFFREIDFCFEKKRRQSKARERSGSFDP